MVDDEEAGSLQTEPDDEASQDEDESVEDDDDDTVSDEDDYAEEYYDDSNADLLTDKLDLPDNLSPQFYRFYQEFTNSMDFIIKYEYNLSPNLIASPAIEGMQEKDAQCILFKHYDLQKRLCEKNCSKFKGPYSVLQIYIERIVDTILAFKAKWRNLAIEELGLITMTAHGRKFAPLLPNL